ncbi:zinc finger protein 83 [Microplitis demolitor]|uniref:zinc finger protein 83 n=1 Tax=Microplitis demolitor TaxID=69319 RepID=UPI0004CD5F2D|nr:zinc finger protein 83 [Microplitis demolitor]
MNFNSSSNIPHEYLPTVVLEKLDIPENSIVIVATNSEDIDADDQKNSESNRKVCYKIRSIEYICQRCSQSFSTAELHRKHILCHHAKEERDKPAECDTASKVSDSNQVIKTQINKQRHQCHCDYTRKFSFTPRHHIRSHTGDLNKLIHSHNYSSIKKNYIRRCEKSFCHKFSRSNSQIICHDMKSYVH